MTDDVLNDRRLALMSLPAALSVAVSMSGKDADAICAAMNWSPKIGYRILNPQDDYWPSLPSLPRLCGVLQNFVIPRWIIISSQANYPMTFDVLPLNAERMIVRLAELFDNLGRVASEGKKALDDDGEIDVAEARRIRKRVETLMATASQIINELDAIK